jgi:CheY-like chemotaxis protein
MQQIRFPFAVRLIGFLPHEAMALGVQLAAIRATGGVGCTYFRLDEDNLSDLRPALMIGSGAAAESSSPYPRIAKPVKGEQLLAALDELVARRADALSRLEASDVVTVPERRRRERAEQDARNPADYAHLRRAPVDGGVLIVDKDAALADYTTELLSRRQVAVHWVKDEVSAVALCRRQKISLVLVNTSVAGLDPYRLCETVKRGITERMTVVFLVGVNFSYDQARARAVGCDGFLNKPLTGGHVVSVMKKFLPSLTRWTRPA